MMSPRLGLCDLQSDFNLRKERRFSVHSVDVQTGQNVSLLCTRQ